MTARPFGLLLLVACAGFWAGACGSTPPGGRAAGETHTLPDRRSPEDGTPPAGGRGRRPTPQERSVIDDLARTAEGVRDLRFVSRVEVEVHDRHDIVAHLTEELEEEDLEKSRVVYVALGLLPEDMDVRELLERVLGEQVVGYYDHESDRLVIRDDVMRALGRGLRRGGVDEARVTIVHELVHALQDQRLDLGEQFEDDERDTDPDSAYHAVVEGDATLAMIGYLTESTGGQLEWLTRNPDMLRAMMNQAQSVMGQAELASAPAILRVTLLSSYVDGLLFAAALHGRSGWRGVDGAHRAPPVSTEQVLHPEKYLRGEGPDQVEIPDLPALATAGLTLFEEDALGELEMKVYFGQLSDGVDEVAAAGWSGDRLRVYRDGEGAAAVVWFSAWDDPREAAEAEAAAARITAAVPADRRDRYAVVRQGRALLIVRQLDAALHAAVFHAFERWARALPALPPTAAAPP